MYVSLRNRRAAAARDSSTRRRVPGTVLLLGITSMLTDISSEMVTAVLPLFLTLQLGLSPAQFGLVDGLYNGVSAVSRLAAGLASDRLGRPKLVASVGYGLSALTRPLLLLATSVASVAALISADRIGKGIRTAPRDAMIAGASRPGDLASNYGVHRALDNVGAMLGPLLAFGLLLMLPGRFSAVFVVSAAFAFLGLAVLVLLVDGRPAAAGQRPRSDAEGHGQTSGTAPTPAPTRPRLTTADLRALLRSRPFVSRLAVAGLLGAFTVSDAFVFLTLLERDPGLARVFPLLAVGLALSYALLAVPVGRMADRRGRLPVYLGGHTLLLGVYVAAGSLPIVPAVVAVLVLLGLFYAATDGVLAATVSAAVPEVSRASGLSLAQTVVALAAFVSSVAFGLLITWLGIGPAYTVMGAGLCLAVVLGRRVTRSLPAEPAT